MMDRISTWLATALVCVAPVQAQLATSLRVEKKQHLTGEAVIVVVTITNHSGRDQVFQSDGRFQWLDFLVKTANGNPVTPRSRKLFGPMKIGAGQTLAREVDLAEHFQLTEPGNFSVSAVIHAPGSFDEGASTNRAFFNVAPGRIYWSQKVGISGKAGHTREFRVIHFTGDSKTRIYAQVVDGVSGQYVRTFALGDALVIRKPLTTVDRQQRLHVMFLATPSMWVHCVVDTDGKLVSRQIHQRAQQGDPRLLTQPDGSVVVGNSIPYDPEAVARQRAAQRKASDRPPGVR